ncbi:hypothetical protein EHS25_005345 [Saitozyma podzolica]|uniref:LanC-like protein 2 n=1 Tax=Saitozyma podzolica TaxID=1890683 RepID=A0A427XZ38_9TREE|nr:hypothetical protein EHS25_005345 [Saitozyma podzolica]
MMPNHARYIDNPYVVEGETNPTCKFPAKDDLDALVARIGRRVDYTRPDVYVGASGVALLQLHLGDHARALVVAENALRTGRRLRSGCSFLCDHVGLLSVAAVAIHRERPDDTRLPDLIHRIEAAVEYVLRKDTGDELLYGRAGYLYAIQFLRKDFARDPLGSKLPVVAKQTFDAILASGRRSALARGPPLYWRWRGKTYLGAAHGFAGILTVLLQEHRVFGTVITPEDLQAIKATVDWLARLQTNDANLPSTLESGHADLVQFCHGAPGLVLLLTEAMGTFEDMQKDWLRMAEKAGLCVWRKGLLVKGVSGLCHGIAGNAYTFGALHRATGDTRWLSCRDAFATLAVKLLSQSRLDNPDHPYSLFEGIGGLAWLLSDVLKGGEAGFPAFSDVAER